MQNGRKAVWNISYVSVAFLPSLKQNFIAYRSSKESDCVFKIHKLWQSGLSRVYSNCCCSCLFEHEIVKICQSSHTMYSNNILNFQESLTILNACIKKSLEAYWRYHVALFRFRNEFRKGFAVWRWKPKKSGFRLNCPWTNLLISETCLFHSHSPSFPPLSLCLSHSLSFSFSFSLSLYIYIYIYIYICWDLQNTQLQILPWVGDLVRSSVCQIKHILLPLRPQEAMLNYEFVIISVANSLLYLFVIRQHFLIILQSMVKVIIIGHP